MSFLKSSFGISKNNKKFCSVNLLDESGECYRFFAFEDSQVYQKLQNSSFSQLDDVIVSLDISSFNNKITLGDIEGGK